MSSKDMLAAHLPGTSAASTKISFIVLVLERLVSASLELVQLIFDFTVRAVDHCFRLLKALPISAFGSGSSPLVKSLLSGVRKADEVAVPLAANCAQFVI
jgi:hypothetical protein